MRWIRESKYLYSHPVILSLAETNEYLSVVVSIEHESVAKVTSAFLPFHIVITGAAGVSVGGISQGSIHLAYKVAEATSLSQFLVLVPVAV